jgi:hypothetical protein
MTDQEMDDLLKKATTVLEIHKKIDEQSKPLNDAMDAATTPEEKDEIGKQYDELIPLYNTLNELKG